MVIAGDGGRRRRLSEALLEEAWVDMGGNAAD